VTRYWLIGRIRQFLSITAPNSPILGQFGNSAPNWRIAPKQANLAVIYSSDVMMPEATVKIESDLTKTVDLSFLGVADRSF